MVNAANRGIGDAAYPKGWGILSDDDLPIGWGAAISYTMRLAVSGAAWSVLASEVLCSRLWDTVLVDAGVAHIRDSLSLRTVDARAQKVTGEVVS